MRLFRLFIHTLVLAAVGVWSPSAHAAGTLKLGLPQWSGRTQSNRLTDQINQRDCLDNATLTFSTQFLGVTSGKFEVWAGTSCDLQANRETTKMLCAKVKTGAITDTSVALPLQSMLKPFGSGDDSAGTSAVCNTDQGAGQTARTLFFVVFDTGSNMSLIASTPQWTFKYDVRAPAPPTKIKAGSGESALVPSFTAPDGESNLLNYRFYCSPVGPAPVVTTGGSSAGGSSTGGSSTGGSSTGGSSAGGSSTGGSSTNGGTGGVDVAGAAGIDAGGTGGSPSAAGAAAASTAGAPASDQSDDPSCTSSILIPGEPPPKGAIECGQVSAQGTTSATTSGVLTNGVKYAVAIAAEDQSNNVGVLSRLACNIPQEVTGFYEAYRAAGGEAGGGFCTFSPTRRDSVAVGVVLLLAAGAFARRRR